MHDRGMRIIHTIASVRADHGGPSRSVPYLCESLTDAGGEVHLITSVSRDMSVANNFPKGTTQNHPIVESTIFRQAVLSRRFRTTLGKLAQNTPTVVHDHGVWLPTNHAVARESKALRIPRIVSPRGMLSEWSMNRRRWVKRFIWRLYQQRDLKTADAFVVTSELEAADIRRLGLNQPLAVIPNGINFPESLSARNNFTSKQILFLSRIHPKKGLLELVEAFSLAELPAPWHLVIAGPDEGGFQTQVQQRVAELGITDRVSFPGAFDDNAKWQLYADSDLFVLPSFTENFGIVIAEAMAAGLPVITTTGTPWKCLQTENMGWWIAPTVSELVQALTDACKIESSERNEMGKRGAKYTRDSFSWAEIGARVLEFYSRFSDQ